ncbi:ferredoxin, partial [Burkholderia multivorans]
FFDHIAPPGGPAKPDNTGKDHAIISVLPPQNG